MDIPGNQPERGTLADPDSNARYSVDSQFQDAQSLNNCFLKQVAAVQNVADWFRDRSGRPTPEEIDEYLADKRRSCGCSTWCKDQKCTMPDVFAPDPRRVYKN